MSDTGARTRTTVEPRSFVVLDTFRGLAAFYVLLYHASAFLGPRREAFGGVLTWGVQVVLFFFVLSGFCIHYGQARALARSPNATLDIRRFARRRFWRIYPPFLGALCLTFVVDRIGIRLNPSYYADLHISLGQLSRTATWSSGTLIGNVLCFQPGVPTYGSNGPLWSLGYEAVFYAVYPLYFGLSRRFGPAKTLVTVLGASFAALLVFKLLGPVWAIPFGALSTWGIWALGGALADIAAKRMTVRATWRYAVAGVLLLILCGSRTVSWPNASVENYAWGMTWALLIFWTSQSASVAGARLRAALDRFAWSGRVSYSLYLAHAPIVTLLLAISGRGMLEELSPAALFAFTVASGVLSGALLYVAVERHFVGARRASSHPEHAATEPTVAQVVVS